jgi:putative transposase
VRHLARNPHVSNGPQSRFVDSVGNSAENRRWLERELLMADEENMEPNDAVVTTDAEVKPPTAKKQRSPRSLKTTVEPVRAASKATAAKAPIAKPRRYSEQERIEKLKLIETQISEGTSTLKDAIKGAGVSEQTYYQWKRTAKPVDPKEDKRVPAGDELADLVQLEEENQRLRKLLADKLRAENSDLRKRLGLAD